MRRCEREDTRVEGCYKKKEGEEVKEKRFREKEKGIPSQVLD